MTKKQIINDMEKILDMMHDEVFGTEGKVEAFEKFLKLGLDVDAICMLQHDLNELRKLL